MSATIRDVAEAAGVSITTVSFVLNNKLPHVNAIPKETRDRVRECATAIGYKKNAAAASLRTGRSHWIGVIMQPLIDESEAWMWATHELSLLSGIQKKLFEEGYFTVVGSEPKDGSGTGIDALTSSGIGGIIMRCPNSILVKQAQLLVDSGVPAVAVFPLDRRDLYPYSVDMDNRKGGEMIADLFIKSGKKKPVVLIDEQAMHWDIDRSEGFADTIQKNYGFRPPQLLIPETKYENKEQIVVQMLIKDKPDFIIATMGKNAVLAKKSADIAEMKIPEDISIIGFDCHSLRSHGDKKLSSVSVSWWKAGEIAASGVINVMKERSQWTEPKRLDPQFIPGDTTPEILAEGYSKELIF
ncbi:MAG: LacI family DNA-binding transcriptional regulator [Armatimonadota bacterium]